MQKRTREQIVARIAADIPDGSYVNLGIGLPTQVAQFLPSDKEIILHSENGVLAFGPCLSPEDQDPDLINAGKELVSLLDGAALCIMGIHLTLCAAGT